MLKPPESSVPVIDDDNRPTAPPPPEDDASNTAMDTAADSVGDADSGQGEPFWPPETEEPQSSALQPPVTSNRPATGSDSEEEGLRNDRLRINTIDLIIQSMPDRLVRDAEWSLRDTLKQMTRGQLKVFHSIVLSWQNADGVHA